MRKTQRQLQCLIKLLSLLDLWWGLAAIAIAIGAYVRIQQFATQVLLDDEWHVVHVVLRNRPWDMFINLGVADYGIPLGLLTWLAVQLFPVTEVMLRLPMLICGIGSIAIFSIYVGKRMSACTGAIFAMLLATAPLLIIFSRMARPYAITLPLGWVAHVALYRAFRTSQVQWSPAFLYVALAVGASWLHPIVAPFVFAALLWQACALLRRDRHLYVPLLATGFATTLALGLLLAPPLLANPMSIASKTYEGHPDLETLVGAWHLFVGTSSVPVAVVCLLLGAAGIRRIWSSLPEIRGGIVGSVLLLAFLVVTRPAYSEMSLTFARYMLPALPLVLLMVACGLERMVVRLIPNRLRIARHVLLLLLCAVIGTNATLIEMMRNPNSYSLHPLNFIDLRSDRNPYLRRFAAFPSSDVWTQLADPSTHGTIAVAPFHFESFNWEGPLWERESGRRVIPGYLAGLCSASGFGETPDIALFDLRNAAHLAKDDELRSREVAYVVWQKQSPLLSEGTSGLTDPQEDACRKALNLRFGRPVFEDDHFIAYRP